MLARQDIELLDDLPAGHVIDHLELRDETIQLGFRNVSSASYHVRACSIVLSSVRSTCSLIPHSQLIHDSRSTFIRRRRPTGEAPAPGRRCGEQISGRSTESLPV